MKRWLVAIAVLVVCVVALVVNARWVDSETRTAGARDGGTIVDTGVEQANVRVDGTGPMIVLIHGFGAAVDWWDEVAPQLASDHRVIRIDLIGHGGTAAPASGYSIERQAALVSAVLDKLGVDRFTVIGHSMGGEVATALAYIKPERVERLVLIDSPPIAETKFSLLTKAYLTPYLGEFMARVRSERAMRRGLEQGFAPGYPVPERFVADLEQLTYTAFREAHDDSVAYRTAMPTYERIAALKPEPPLLVIFGSLDAIVPPDTAQLFTRVPGAKIVTIEDAGHSPMVEAPVKTLEAIRSFLSPAP
jgi:pimeloyl-ACP methyl ester carboxylesterase